MPLSVGIRLGSYEIIERIGSGGMGDVYRARDTRLDRDVAIKVLPDTFALDPDREARFTREAKTLAALNHPNIAAIYGVEESGSTRALVMELVPGPTLDEVIRGNLAHRTSTTDDFESALSVARQIVDALEAAHDQGIVHRDLKPANIKVKPDGTVKVLDFGLAKALSADGALGSSDAANSPTLTARATQLGIVIGTAAYMAPEQARGRPVDKRADVWAFGVVLYEMLTGRQAFAGETITDTLAAVVMRDPDWTALPAATPHPLIELLARCLEKDPKRRLRDIGDARFALEGARPSSGSSPGASRAAALPASLPPPAARLWPWKTATAALAVATAILAVGLWMRSRSGSAALSPGFELALSAPPGTEFQIGSNSGNVIVSPDGSKVAFVASSEQSRLIWVRSLETGDAKPLPGTEDAFYPFWSADGRKLGFFARGKLKTVDVAGGLPETIADAPQGRGGSWSQDDTIIFSPVGGGAISRVSAHGGPVVPLTTLDLSRGENAHYWPVFLPGGAQYLYFVRSTNPENNGIYLAWLDRSRPAVRLVSSLASGIPVIRPSTGELYLLWVREGDLLAQPLDAAHATLRGEAVVIGHDVRVNEGQRQAFVGASNTGILAWASARATVAQFELYGRDGRRLRTLNVPPGSILQPMISPDGQRLLFTRVEKGNGDVYLYDMRTNVPERLTTNPDYDETPTWTPDGSAVIYTGAEGGQKVLRRLSFGAAAPTRALYRGPMLGSAFETRDGRFVLLSIASSTGADIIAQPTAGGEPVVLAKDPESSAVLGITTDGRWAMLQRGNTASIVRVHDESGRPAFGASIALPPGTPLSLARDGHEAYVAMPDSTVKAVALNLGAETGSIGSQTALFKIESPLGFAANETGTEFVLADAPFAGGQTLTVLTDWERRLDRPGSALDER